MSATPPPAVWTFPDITPGDHILASRDPTRSDRTLAVVTKLKFSDNAVHAVDAIAFFPGGTVSLRDLWHVDDPRIKAEPLRFKNASNGVFVLAPDKEARQELLTRMAALEQRFAALERYVADDLVLTKQPEYPRKYSDGESAMQELSESTAAQPANEEKCRSATDILRPRRGRPPKVREPKGVTA